MLTWWGCFQNKAKEHRLYEYAENIDGKVDLERKYKLSLAANPRNLGRNSRNQGLGVYFLTGIFLMILLIVLSLISIYPMANNAASAMQAVRPGLNIGLSISGRTTGCTFTSAPGCTCVITAAMLPHTRPS